MPFPVRLALAALVALLPALLLVQNTRWLEARALTETARGTQRSLGAQATNQERDLLTQRVVAGINYDAHDPITRHRAATVLYLTGEAEKASTVFYPRFDEYGYWGVGLPLALQIARNNSVMGEEGTAQFAYFFLQFLRQPPVEPGALYRTAARLFYNSGDVPNALFSFHESFRYGEQQAEVALDLAATYGQLGLPEMQRHFLARAIIEADRPSPVIAQLAGWGAHAETTPESVAALLDLALMRPEVETSAVLQLGQNWLQSGRTGLAKLTAETVEKQRPGAPDTLLFLAIIASVEENKEQAISQISRFLKEAPADHPQRPTAEKLKAKWLAE